MQKTEIFADMPLQPIILAAAWPTLNKLGSVLNVHLEWL